MSEYTFSENWLPVLAAKNITSPTPVQKEVIPVLQEGKNVLFQSETGTGKTIAYLLPILEGLDPASKDVQLIIAAPTHELASQIKGEVKSLCSLNTALLIGGAPLKRQQELLKDKPAIVIGGPARLLELIRIKKLKTEKVRAFVLDEADRLLSPELRDDTTALTAAMPATAQIAGCSATIKSKIAQIIKDSMPRSSEDGAEPELQLIQLPQEDILQRKITHWAFYAEQRDKIDMLRKLLAAEKPVKALIFTARPDQAMNIAAKLQYKKIDCAALHAREDKQERKQAIDRFRSGKCPILITSDLASRGLDFPGITHIIQMDVPTNDDFFIHRAGRTARAGATGINAIIGDAHELRLLRKLERRLGFTVYPRQLYNGKVVEPMLETEAAPAPRAPRSPEALRTPDSPRTETGSRESLRTPGRPRSQGRRSHTKKQ